MNKMNKETHRNARLNELEMQMRELGYFVVMGVDAFFNVIEPYREDRGIEVSFGKACKIARLAADALGDQAAYLLTIADEVDRVWEEWSK